MIDTDKYEGHTPADQWTIYKIYKMGADKPYHAVRFGQRGLDLELEFGADAQLIADAPLLLAEVMRLREELDEREAYIKRLSEQLSRATKWAYKQVLHNDSAMMDFDDYVWGEEE